MDSKTIYSCFACFIESLNPFEFDGELVYYPLFGTREIQLQDTVVIFDKDGIELAKVNLESYEEGFLSFLKMEIVDDLGISDEEFIMLIEPFDVKIRNSVY